MKKEFKFTEQEPNKPGEDPKEPWRPTDPEPANPTPGIDPNPGEPDPYPVTDPIPGEPPPVPTPPEPIPEFPPDVTYRVGRLSEDIGDGEEGHDGYDHPQYNALKQRPVAEFFYRLM